MQINDSIFLGSALPEMPDDTLVIQQNKRLLFLSLLGNLIEIIVRGTSPLSLPDAIANSLEYLKAFGGTEQRNLPAGHQELTYLQGDGTAYIETDVEPTNNTGMKIVFEFGELDGSAAISGVYDGTNPRQDTFFVSTNSGSVSSNTTIFIAHRGDTTSPSSSEVEAPVVGKTYTALINYMNDGYFGFEGFNQKQLTTLNDVLSNKVLLFARLNYNNNNITASTCKIKYVEFTEGTEVIRKYYPDSHNNELGLYDTVTNTFLTNKNSSGAFTAGADVTVPTPDTPMDIVCNNGVLKARHQSGLPLGYQAVEYIESTGTQYIDTGVIIGSSPYEIFVDFQATSLVDFESVYGARISSQAARLDNWFGTNAGGYGLNDTSTQALSSFTTNRTQIINTRTSVTKNGIPDVVSSYNNSANIQYSMYLFATNNANTAVNPLMGKIYRATIKKDNILSFDGVPARRNSDNVLGMYDTVSGTFLTNAGTGTFTAGNTVSDPVEIYTDGTVETINVHGKNLFDKEQTYISAYVNVNTGVLTEASGNQRSFVVGCLPNTTYTLSGMTAASGWGAFTSSTIGTTATNFTAGNGTITTGANDKYLIGMAYVGNGSSYDYRNTLQIERGSTATTYENYFNGGTATAKMLLKVGDYEDVQEILSGSVTRNVGVKVLDGTEDWNMVSTAYADGTHRIYTNDFGYDQNTNGISTHFVEAPLTDRDLPTGQQGKMYHSGGSFHLRATQFTSLEVAKQWLADQYAAGTPVIVIYPLATPTTESVAGQALQVQQGDNFVEITQASLDNLELEAKYKKGA